MLRYGIVAPDPFINLNSGPTFVKVAIDSEKLPSLAFILTAPS